MAELIKIVATRCQILTLKCTEVDFGWGSAPDPAGGAYSAPPDPLAGFKGPTSKGWEGRGGEGEGRGGIDDPSPQDFQLATGLANAITVFLLIMKSLISGYQTND